MISLIVLIDPDIYTILAYVSSVMTIVYMSYRMLIRELEKEILMVYEQKLKKQIDDEVIVVYEKRLKKDIEELIKLYCTRDRS
ncbi:hypothetical protein SBFV2_gp45 [Sulfolobales Beppu filamentous virus 2]|uniref:Uncharacterized protein n=1 Tax=Sulfolobales Beppu filamentous virus 2 TaxID=2493123 RepID=A0A3S8NF13_9VIRU|nr:hypothetical protein HOU84_gp45 [Sulfolobales Beppu filamentous virus 2]AZI75812.1 hypothetical protein SBFV2_gp45 [Sulfolobales Beppu filamentous virus 2]